MLALGAMIATGGCGGDVPSDEDALRQWVSDAEQHAEEKDRAALMDMVAERYADQRGNDKKALGNMFRVLFLRQNTIALLTTINEIHVDAGSAAQLGVTVGMAGTSGNVLGLSADAYRFDLELEKSSDQWLLIGAQWAPLGR